MKLIECPRDAIQGIRHFIPTEAKASYLNSLLQAGFDTIDFGSFVSPKAIPQMADTSRVLELLDIGAGPTKLLAIVANERGAMEACAYKQISCLGYPFSISETFQQRNTGASIAQSLERVKVIQELCVCHGKQLVIYISMGFGNPYGDPWDTAVAMTWVDSLAKLGIAVFSLADTVGMATPVAIGTVLKGLISAYPKLEFGVHLHTTPETAEIKLEAAWQAGCRRFDGAILGYGGCPMAADVLLGNMPTESLLQYAAFQGVSTQISPASLLALEIEFKQLINN